METIAIKTNHTYLVKDAKYISRDLTCIKVLDITETAYRLEYESGIISWKSKTNFEYDYDLVEDITEYRTNQTIDKITNEMKTVCTIVPCTKCNGEGRVPDNDSTTGDATCPCCFGSKVKFAETIIKF